MRPGRPGAGLRHLSIRRWWRRCPSPASSVPAGLPADEDFALPGRPALEEALLALDASWSTGPFAEPARELLRAHALGVRERVRVFDTTAAGVRSTRGSWVAPRERDLWMVLDADLTGWEEYRERAAAVALDREALALYRERCALAEICEYVAQFRRPHEETPDTQASWAELGEYLR